MGQERVSESCSSAAGSGGSSDDRQRSKEGTGACVLACCARYATRAEYYYPIISPCTHDTSKIDSQVAGAGSAQARVLIFDPVRSPQMQPRQDYADLQM